MAAGGKWAAYAVLGASVLLGTLSGTDGALVQKDVWAEKWCELNDCFGYNAAEQQKQAVAKVEQEHRKIARRYAATGEVKAIRSESTKSAYFGYDGPTLDHPAFPGVAAEHAERAERMHEEHALGFRDIVAKRAAVPPQPGGGYLLPGSDEAKQLAVREVEESAVAIARRRHGVMKEQLRMGCMYEYDQEAWGDGGFKYGGGRLGQSL